MRRFYVVALAVSFALVATGCPKKKSPAKKPGTGTAKATKPKPKEVKSPNALPADKAWATGKTKGVTLAVKTELKVAGMVVGKKAKDAPPTNAMTQIMHVTEGRGVVIETTENGPIPKGTELRYSAVAKKYVLADPAKKQYWAMTGSQLGNVMEGGPELTRSNFAITVTDTKEKAKIAGFDTVRSDAIISFDWKVKTKKGDKKGKIKVKLALWHSADAKLSDAWGDSLISLMAIPFQDVDSQKVVDELKKKIKFPVKWAMEFVQEGGKQEKGESFPKLVTTATKIEVTDLDKSAFQWPPVAYKPAMGPYTFGEGGQTMGEGDLGKLPAKEGKKPAGVEPVDGKGAKKAG